MSFYPQNLIPNAAIAPPMTPPVNEKNLFQRSNDFNLPSTDLSVLNSIQSRCSAVNPSQSLSSHTKNLSSVIDLLLFYGLRFMGQRVTFLASACRLTALLVLVSLSNQIKCCASSRECVRVTTCSVNCCVNCRCACP